jgi:hypothetical protein
MDRSGLSYEDFTCRVRREIHEYLSPESVMNKYGGRFSESLQRDLRSRNVSYALGVFFFWRSVWAGKISRDEYLELRGFFNLESVTDLEFSFYCQGEAA